MDDIYSPEPHLIWEMASGHVASLQWREIKLRYRSDRSGTVGFAPRGQYPLLAAGSTDRCNTGVKSICWRLEGGGLAGPFVELAGPFVQMRLGVDRQVGPLGEILPQQTIGVLVGTELSGAFRIAEVHGNVCCQRKSPMIRKLLATVPGQGFVQLSRQRLRLPDERRYHRLRLLVGDLRQHHVTCMALHQGSPIPIASAHFERRIVRFEPRC